MVRFSSMPLIEFQDFSFKYYGSDFLALKKINLTIDQGEYVVITGPSGCGKTTLCRTINGLVPQFHRGYIAGNVAAELAQLNTLDGDDLGKLLFQAHVGESERRGIDDDG